MLQSKIKNVILQIKWKTNFFSENEKLLCTLVGISNERVDYSVSDRTIVREKVHFHALRWICIKLWEY